MWKSITAAALITFALATPAAAQRADAFTGVWAIQTEAYGLGGGDEAAGIMSGVANIRRSGRSYSIRLVAQEVAIGDGQSQILSAVQQTCRGDLDGGQLTITCTLGDNAPEGYLPDNFVVQEAEAGLLAGVLNSAVTAPVQFVRLR